MAKPIEPTPVLKGKASIEEKERVARGAKFIESLLTFTF